jgi:hypothetical protein
MNRLVRAVASVALIAGLAVGGFSATSAMASTTPSTTGGSGQFGLDKTSHGSPIGSWLLTIDANGLPQTTAVAAFAAGGVYTETNLNPPTPNTGLGSWARTGANTFTVTFWQPETDPAGNPVVVRVIADGHVTGDHIASTFTVNVFAPADLAHPLPVVLTGHTVGDRVEA